MVYAILNVAEKPSVAKELSNILGNGRPNVSNGRSQYNKIYEFQCQVGQYGNCNMVMTSVTGHLKEHEFEAQFTKWNSCSPAALFEAGILQYVPEDKKALEVQLKELARRADMLMLWLDCDREGEAIAYEVVDTVRSVKPNIRLLRARFSALIPADIHRAVAQPGVPDQRLADAVRARQEIDLRLGAAFTRLQTMALNERFDELQGMVISYGPCQFPTLGFVVDRYRLIEAFVPEDFWAIHLALAVNDGDGAAGQGGQGQGGAEGAAEDLSDDEGEGQGQGQGQAGGPGLVRRRSRYNARPGARYSDTNGRAGNATAGANRANTRTISFTWARGRLYDQLAAQVLYEKAQDAGQATVMSVWGYTETRRRPIPMNTVEMQTAASRLLRMSATDVMKWAETLYTEGYMSYPRTETESFKEGTDLLGLIRAHTGHGAWGGHASSLVDGQRFLWPIAGSRDDQAHPPIHPLRCATRADFQGKSDGHQLWRLYELVTRHFLACCSPDATGQKTKVEVEMGGERFTASGTIVTDQGWLAVYPYSKWGGHVLPTFVEGQVFVPSSLDLHQGSTRPPDLLTEADLLEAMDSHGIGTDATMAEHIGKIQERAYCEKTDGDRLTPTTLGMALLQAYEGLDIPLGKPWLRANMEAACNAIAAGTRSKEDVVAAVLAELRPQYDKVLASLDSLVAAMGQYFTPLGAAVGQGNGGAGHGQGWRVDHRSIARCGDCKGHMELRSKAGQGHDQARGRTTRRYALHCPACCTGWPMPKYALAIGPCPPVGTVQPAGQGHACPLCGYGVVQYSRHKGQNSNEVVTGTVCPKCYSSPPREYNSAAPDELHASLTPMDCSRCTARQLCSLASGSKKMVTGSVAARMAVAVRPCAADGQCMGLMQLQQGRDGKWRLSCDGGGAQAGAGAAAVAVGGCKNVVWLPHKVAAARVSDKACPRCSDPGHSLTVRLVDLAFPSSSVPAHMLNLQDGPPMPVTPRPGQAAQAAPSSLRYNCRACLVCNDDLVMMGLSATQQTDVAQMRAVATAIAGGQARVQGQPNAGAGAGSSNRPPGAAAPPVCAAALPPRPPIGPPSAGRPVAAGAAPVAGAAAPSGLRPPQAAAAPMNRAPANAPRHAPEPDEYPGPGDDDEGMYGGQDDDDDDDIDWDAVAEVEAQQQAGTMGMDVGSSGAGSGGRPNNAALRPVVLSGPSAAGAGPISQRSGGIPGTIAPAAAPVVTGGFLAPPSAAPGKGKPGQGPGPGAAPRPATGPSQGQGSQAGAGADGPPCKKCQSPTVQRTSNSANNPGRQFWTCTTDGFHGWCDDPRSGATGSGAGAGGAGGGAGGACHKCGQTGHWARDCPNTSAAGSYGSSAPSYSSSSYSANAVVPAEVGYSANGLDFTSEGLPICPQHRCACTHKTSNSPANPGRMFYSCPANQRDDPTNACGSFWWADEPMKPRGGSGARGGHGAAGGSWGRRGEAAAGGGAARSYGGGSGGGGGGGSGECYKCGQPGHWAKDCPNPGQGGGRGGGAGGWSSRGGRGGGGYGGGHGYGGHGDECGGGGRKRKAGAGAGDGDGDGPKAPRGPPTCGLCGQKGHTRRTCPSARG